MRNNLYTILAGIFLNALGIILNFPVINIVGSVIILVGISYLNRTSVLLKKVRKYTIISIPFAVLSTFISYINTQGFVTLAAASIGISVFFFIYITYYLTESLIDRAKTINQLAAVRSFRVVWTLCGIVTFIYFMAASTTGIYPIIITAGRAILLLCTIYYCFTINNSAKYLINK